jgi:hypothetical protein
MSAVETSVVYRYVAPSLLTLGGLNEAIRLYLASAGNLGERVSQNLFLISCFKVPELAACLIMIVCPQLVIVSYYLFIQALTDRTWTYELVIHSIYLAILVPEWVLVYLTARRIIRHQAHLFYLAMNPGGDVGDGETTDRKGNGGYRSQSPTNRIQSSRPIMESELQTTPWQ